MATCEGRLPLRAIFAVRPRASRRGIPAFAAAVILLIPVASQAQNGIRLDPEHVNRIERDAGGRLSGLRAAALKAGTVPLQAVSLRRLAESIREQRQSGTPLTSEQRTLAGLNRIDYLFVD